ncbi:hypothetical protein R1sor_022935 [Riccia sorocarpa]|uniref:Uncharacterized protein n=1 Tax=Riccia sorocarpa TaxID=122646 RepID=A0ABD3GNH0_9MARC
MGLVGGRHTGGCVCEVQIRGAAEDCPLGLLSMEDGLPGTGLLDRCGRLEAMDIGHVRRTTVGSFHWNMLISHEFVGVDLPDGDQEAVTNSSYMPGLKHLDLKSSNSLMNFGLMRIASDCRKVESLDITCCCAVSTLTKLKT